MPFCNEVSVGGCPPSLLPHYALTQPKRAEDLARSVPPESSWDSYAGPSLPTDRPGPFQAQPPVQPDSRYQLRGQVRLHYDKLNIEHKKS